jgi:hypothetical protein
MTRCILLFLAIFLFCGATGKAQNKIEKVCKSVVSGGKYKWVSISPLLKEPDNVFGYVLVKPKQINRGFMMRLAERLKSEYCDARKFQVIIFDDRKYANGNSMQDYVRSQGKIILMRGFYTFDRSAGLDRIEFSSKRGNPTTETQIDMSDRT